MKKIALIISTCLLTVLFINCNGNNDNEDSELKERKQLYPPDYVLTDESLVKFIDNLDNAVQKRDTNFIYAHIDSNIHLSFGGHVGIDDFKQLWKIDDSTSKFWGVMGRIMALGGEMVDTIYYSPYVFSSWRNIKEDGFTHFAVIDSNVNLYETASNDSKIITKLDYEIVKYDSEKSLPESGEPKNQFMGKDWYFIETLDRTYSGYIYWDKLYSPVGYRMIIKKYSDIWKIKTLIAGD